MERNLSKNAFLNLLALLGASAALLALARYEKSATAEIAAVLVGIGFLVALVGWFQMRLEAREEAERLEVEALSRSRNDSALFSESAAETFPARRAREQFERWLVPAFTAVLFLLETVAVGWYRKDLLANPDPMSSPDPTLALAAFSSIGLVLFLLGKYSARLAQLEDSRLLRPGSSSVLMAAGMAAISAGIAAADWFGFPKYDLYAAWVLVALVALIALETLVTLVFERFRPRTRGKTPRIVYESRIVGLLGQSGGLFSTAAHALDYQFGFKVSETWFYKFLEGAIAKLVLVWIGILAVCSCFVVIQPGEQGLLERFGSPVGDGVREPGLHFKLPWPIDAMVRHPSRELRSFHVGYVADAEAEKERTLLWTRAHYKEEFNLLVASREQQANQVAGDTTVPINLLSVSIPVQYVISDLRAWEYNHANAGDLLERIANREVVRYMASVDMDKVMSFGRLEASRDLQSAIQKHADDAKLGVQIIFVGLQDIHPPVGTKQVQVAAAYEEVIGAVALKEARILVAEGYSAETLPMAAANAARKLNEAQASATRKTAVAAGQSAQFVHQMAAFDAAPKVFRQRSYLDTFAKAVGPARKLVIGPTNTTDVVIINLEDKLSKDLMDVGIENPGQKK